MAIDDAKNYTLTGEQIKELPSKIDAAKGFARTLSEADYNWNSVHNNTNEPLDSVAIWLLPPGIYVAPVGLIVKILSNQNASTGVLYIVGGQSSYGTTVVELRNVNYASIGYETGTTYVINYSGSAAYTFHMGSVVDALDGALYTTRPLSAKQGYVLSNMIGVLNNLDTNHKDNLVAAVNELQSEIPLIKDSAPTTADAGHVGQLLTDTTNMHTYQCTAIDRTDPDNPLYTWTLRW